MIGKSMPGSGAMEGGGAYNRHATIPAQGAAAALPYLEAAARAVSFDLENDPVVIADYGSSEGRNSLAPMRIAIDISARVSVRVGRLLFVIPICP